MAKPVGGLVVALTCLALAAPTYAAAGGSAVSVAAVDTDGDGLSDHFETLRSKTDPALADTDGNGLPDSVEDPDRDGLSNWGEQRFHTKPLVEDSDGDGVPDGRDDANRNGIPDGLEQDGGRSVPADLHPTLAKAGDDQPVSYTDGCHVPGSSTTFRECDYGARDGAFTVALFGDSHAAQWLPALIEAATRNNWTVNNLTRSGCPSATVYVWSRYEKGPDTRCAHYRKQAIRWLNDHPPDLIVLSNLHGTTLYNADGSRVPTSQREGRWADGLTTTLTRLPTSSTAVVLADGAFVSDPAACLRHHLSSFGDCEQSRVSVIDRHHNRLEKRTAKAAGAAFVDLTYIECSYDPCPVIAAHVLMYRDTGHLGATFSRSIWAPLYSALDSLLAHESRTPGGSRTAVD